MTCAQSSGCPKMISCYWSKLVLLCASFSETPGYKIMCPSLVSVSLTFHGCLLTSTSIYNASFFFAQLTHSPPLLKSAAGRSRAAFPVFKGPTWQYFSQELFFFKDFFVNNRIPFNIPWTHLFAFWRTPSRPLSEVSFWNTSGKLDRSCHTSLRCCTREKKDSTWESPWKTLFWLSGSLDIFRSQTTEKRKGCFSICSCVAYSLWKDFSKLYFYIHNCFPNPHSVLFRGKTVNISQHYWLFSPLEFQILAYLKFK